MANKTLKQEDEDLFPYRLIFNTIKLLIAGKSCKREMSFKI